MPIEEVSNSQPLTPVSQPIPSSSRGSGISKLECAINVFGAMGVAATPFLLRGRGSFRVVKPMINQFNSYIAREFAHYGPRLSPLFGKTFIPSCVRNSFTRFPSFVPHLSGRLPVFPRSNLSFPTPMREAFNRIRAGAKQHIATKQGGYLFKLIKASRLPIQTFMKTTMESAKRIATKSAPSEEVTGMVLFAFASTAFAQYQTRKNAKVEGLTSTINSQVETYKETGKELSLLLREQQAKRTEATLALENDIEQLIEQFPEEERENIRVALDHLSHDLAYTTEIADLQIQDALDQLNKLKALPHSHMAIAKDLASNLASALVGIGISLSFGRFTFAKEMVQGIIRMGIPETVINKMLIGVVTTGMQEVALLVTDQNVTAKDTKKVSDEILKDMGINLQDKPPVSEEEEQMSRALGNITLSIIAKFMTSMIDNPMVSEMTEAALQQTLQASVTNVEEYLPSDALEETVKENLKPVEDHINTLSKRVSNVSEQGTKKLQKFKQATQQQLSLIQEQAAREAAQRAEQEQKTLQTRVQPMTAFERIYDWSVKAATSALSVFI
jgi:hypothetical protein